MSLNCSEKSNQKTEQTNNILYIVTFISEQNLGKLQVYHPKQSLYAVYMC